MKENHDEQQAKKDNFANLKLVDQTGAWDQFRTVSVTADETWVPFFDSPTTQKTKVLAKKGNKSAAKGQTRPALWKVMLAVFLSNCLGLLRIEFLSEATDRCQPFCAQLNLSADSTSSSSPIRLTLPTCAAASSMTADLPGVRSSPHDR